MFMVCRYVRTECYWHFCVFSLKVGFWFITITFSHTLNIFETSKALYSRLIDRLGKMPFDFESFHEIYSVDCWFCINDAIVDRLLNII